MSRKPAKMYRFVKQQTHENNLLAIFQISELINLLCVIKIGG
jgi:hypothetical protein